jgi:hypothetical protein
MLKGLRYAGGEIVKAGFYWNLREWEANIVPREGGPLKGAADAQYVRVPLPVLLFAAPIMGAAYAMFLPFIGFAMVAMFLTGRLKALFTTTPPADAAVAGNGTGSGKRAA